MVGGSNYKEMSEIQQFTQVIYGLLNLVESTYFLRDALIFYGGRGIRKTEAFRGILKRFSIPQH